jgi:hypothetical protein
VLQKVTHLQEKAKMPSKKVGQKKEHFLKRESKSGVLFQKVLQKVAYLCINIRGFRGDFAPNWMHFAVDIQNAYLAKDS